MAAKKKQAAKKAVKRDANTDTAIMIADVTGTPPPMGESLLGDPKLKSAYRKALDRDAQK